MSADSELYAGALLDKLKNENEYNYLIELISDKFSVSRRWEEISDSTEDSKLSMKYVSDVVRKKRIEILNKLIAENFKKLQSAKEEDEKIRLMKNEKELNTERKTLLNSA